MWAAIAKTVGINIIPKMIEDIYDWWIEDEDKPKDRRAEDKPKRKPYDNTKLTPTNKAWIREIYKMFKTSGEVGIGITCKTNDDFTAYVNAVLNTNKGKSTIIKIAKGK